MAEKLRFDSFEELEKIIKIKDILSQIKNGQMKWLIILIMTLILNL